MKTVLLALLLLIPDTMPLPVHIGGRVAAAGRFGWPGVYFEGRFKGRSVTVKVETNGEPLRLLVDGAVKATLAGPGETEFTVSELADAEHVVRLEKVTESQTGGPRFLGFTTSGTALPWQARKRQIEFIGDSHSVGYGNTSTTRECDEARVRATTDTQLAFGPLVAKRLGADYRVIAYSGYGVVRNYAGKLPGENLPKIYPRALPGEPAAADDAGWRPQVIVVNLGTNDFSTPLKPGEAWQDDAALRADWRKHYIAFARMLRARQPQARLILMGADTFYADVVQVAAATGAEPLRLGPLERTGCNWHPSLKDHRQTADLVQTAIAELP